MKNYASLVTLAACAIFIGALAGCSSTAANPKVTDLGIINVLGSKSSHHVLRDGRTCIVTPIVLVDGNVDLETCVVERNSQPGEKSKSLSIRLPKGVGDKGFLYSVDTNILFKVTLNWSAQPASPVDPHLAADMNTITNVIMKNGEIYKKAEAGELGDWLSIPIAIGTNSDQRQYILTWYQSKWQVTPMSQ